MSRWLTALGVPVVVALSACTAIVAGQLSAYDDYSRDGGASHQQADHCSILPTNDASAECAQCILDGCKDELDYACPKDNVEKSWFQSIQSCAAAPYREFSPIPSQFQWQCDAFDDPDAATVPGNDDPAHKANSKVCIYQHCLAVEAPPCKLCPVSIVEDGTRYGLDNSTCGQCMLKSCSAEIVQCCNADVVQYQLKYCADPRDLPSSSGDTNQSSCKAIAAIEAGTSAPNGINDICNKSLPSCLRSHCLSQCTNF